MNGDERPLLIEPVVAWPRQAETDCDYLVTVDLRGPLPAGGDTSPAWPYPDEEFTFTVALDGAPHFVCTALDEPSVVLHRFGGTYGAARFRVSTGRQTGTAALWLTVSNEWGVPVRKAELRSEIREREPGRAPAARLAAVVRERASSETWLPIPPTPPSRAPGRPERAPVPEKPYRGSPPERVEARPPARTGRQTLTISFAGFNRAWAAWIGDRLERRGHRVVYQRWDLPDGVRLTESLRDLLLAPGPVLLVISDWYIDARWTHAEWNAALNEVVPPNAERFAAVVVTSSALPSAVDTLAAADLTDIGADEAERRVLDRLGLPADHLLEPAAGAPRGPRFPPAKPEVWGGVPRRNIRFTGREPLLNDIYHLLQGAEPGAGVVTLHGMSGMGKTQLAAEYVYRFGSEYDVVWWVAAEKRVTYRRGLAELASELGLTTGVEYGERLRAVRDSLRRGDPYFRWLLVLDSADEPDQIWDLVPIGPGHVLITSRNQEWSEHNSRLLEVSFYERAESVAFIRRRAPRVTEAEADLLAEALEDLPLLLDQTAGWLNDSDLSVRDYITLLEDGIDEEIVKVSADFPIAFRTAWSILLNKLQDTVPESVDLLRLCTFFAPGSIPVHLLRETPTDGLQERLAGLLMDPAQWNRALHLLRQYSVVRSEAHQGEAAVEILYLHRMVHQIVRKDMPDEDRRVFIDVVRRALAAADPGTPADTRVWHRYAEIVPHLKYADVLRSADPAVRALVLNCLRYMYLSGEYGAGVRFAERAVPVWQELLGTHDELVWDLGHHYANLLRACGDYRHSEAVSRAALEQQRDVHGPGHPGYLRAAGSLAADLRALARHEEALALSQEVLAGYTELLGEEDRRTLAACNNMAVSLRLLGRYEEALDIDRRTLEDRRRILGHRQVWTLYSEIFFATDLRLLGRYAEAESLQKASTGLHGLVLGRDHPQTLHAEYNLAQCRYQAGEYEAAQAQFAGVLARGERVLGEHDPRTLMFAVGNGCFAREHGDIDEAREIGESVVARYERLLSEAHPYAAGVRANHALVLRDVGERDQAHALADRALADMTAAVGENHPWTLGCAINATALRNLVGDPESAAALARDTVARATDTLGRTHPLTLSARVALAADLRALRDRQQAAKTEEEALADLAATLGPRHVHTVSARSRNRPHWDFEPLTT